KYYPYISFIYDSITETNLKSKIIEYLDIYKRHSDVLGFDVIRDFVFTHFSISNFVKQNVFLCVLLALAIKEKLSKSRMPLESRLPENFPSFEMLQTFKDVNVDDLPRGVLKVLPRLFCAVVQHISVNSTKFEWMKAFEVAPIIDPRYTFLDHFKVHVYSTDLKGHESNFLESLKNFAKPCMDKIENDEIYVKVCKGLLSLCQSIGAVIFLWQNIFHPDSNIYEDLCAYSLDNLHHFILNDNAVGLEKHLKEVPNDFNLDYALLFRERVLKLLNSFKMNWNKDNIESILRLLNNTRLDWQEDSALQALNVISVSSQMELLQIFPNQLVNFLEEDLKDIDSNDRILSKVCTQWLETTLEHIKDAQNKSKHTENFACTIFHYLSIMYTIMKKYNITCLQLFNAAEEATENLKDDVIFEAAVDIGDLKQKELVMIFSRVLHERLGPNIKTGDNQLLGKIMQICRSNGQKLHIPNALCEEIIFHILTKLQENLPNIDINKMEIIEDNLQKILIASSNFWVYILKATGSVEGLHNRHNYVKTV
ncbi:22407_t:CDS:2, partial [Racocetra persica]